MVKVKDRMARVLNTIPLSSTAMDAAKTLTEKKFSSIFIEEKGQIVGVATDTDLIRKVMAPGKDATKTPVGDIMTKEVFTIDLNSSLTEAGDMMDKNYVRHLGVTENAKIIGIISVRDLIHPMYTDGEGW